MKTIFCCFVYNLSLFCWCIFSTRSRDIWDFKKYSLLNYINFLLHILILLSLVMTLITVDYPPRLGDWGLALQNWSNFNNPFLSISLHTSFLIHLTLHPWDKLLSECVWVCARAMCMYMIVCVCTCACGCTCSWMQARSQRQGLPFHPDLTSSSGLISLRVPEIPLSS